MLESLVLSDAEAHLPVDPCNGIERQRECPPTEEQTDAEQTNAEFGNRARIFLKQKLTLQ